MAQDFTPQENLAFGGLVTAGTTGVVSGKSTKSALVQDALNVLNSGGITSFETPDVEHLVPIVLGYLDRHCPHVNKDTANVVTVADSKEVDLSDVGDVLWAYKAEYKVDEEPKQFRNISHEYGDTYRLHIDAAPDSAGDSVYIYYTTPHICTNTASNNTLNKAQEDCLVLGLIAFASYARNSSPVYDIEMARQYANTQTYGSNPSGVHLNIASLIQKTDSKSYSMLNDFTERLKMIAKPIPIKIYSGD